MRDRRCCRACGAAAWLVSERSAEERRAIPSALAPVDGLARHGDIGPRVDHFPAWPTGQLRHMVTATRGQLEHKQSGRRMPGRQRLCPHQTPSQNEPPPMRFFSLYFPSIPFSLNSNSSSTSDVTKSECACLDGSGAPTPPSTPTPTPPPTPPTPSPTGGGSGISRPDCEACGAWTGATGRVPAPAGRGSARCRSPAGGGAAADRGVDSDAVSHTIRTAIEPNGVSTDETCRASAYRAAGPRPDISAVEHSEQLPIYTDQRDAC